VQELRIARSRAGMTLMELEAASGVGASTISKIERGVTRPQAITLHKLADALGVEVGELYPKAPAPPHNAGAEALAQLEDSPKNEQLRNHFNHIKNLDSKALAAKLEELGEQYARVHAEWEEAAEEDAASPAAFSLASQVDILSAFAIMTRLQKQVVDNADASSAFERDQAKQGLKALGVAA